MQLSVHWVGCAALLSLLIVGEVWCACTEDNMQIEGGHYTLTKGLNANSMLVYHCPEGFYPYPSRRRVCLLTGTWSEMPRRSKPQTCRMVECPNPFVLMHGSVYPPQEKYFADNETTYECYSGYTLRGSARRVCLPNGKWSGSTPICSRDSGSDCADPGIPAGALRTGNSFGLDDKVKYSCTGNLFLVGSSVRVCLENGQWTGTEPACYYDYTYDTPLEVSEAFGSAIKGSLTTLEPTDDTQEGRKIRISKTGTLNIYIGVDISESIEEKYYIDARDTVAKLITKISSFPISPNYEVVFFSSEIFEVVNILDFLDGKVQLNVLKTKVESFNIGTGNTAGTDLNLVFMTFLERMALIKQRTGEEGFKEHRHVIILFTDGAYNMGGSPEPTVEKIKNLVYMDPNYKQKEPLRAEYLDIYIFAIGAQIFDDDLEPLVVGTGGNHYFRMKDIKKLQKTFDEIIDEDEVKGLCGLHKDYVTTEKRENYPWSALIVVQNEGRVMKCMGSLVTPMFILTAAHCFTFEDLPKHVTVDIDDGQGRTKKVKNFFLHPKFNISAKVSEGVKEFYDYDVALIQLTEFVKISTLVRPICIPCTQETNDALKLVGESTCAEQEQLLLKDMEKLTFLTRSKTKWVDEKHVHAKLGDKRDECIQHALEAPGITAQKAEIPVTENFLCTGGRAPFRDHIACTGDSGGAVFKNYEHRTVQIGVVSWGSKNLCKGGGVVDSDDDSRDFHINVFRVVPFLKSILGNDNQDDYAPLEFLKS
ncbi:complement factor B-like [Hippocampus zosterae]|uniref:complement factor B-like n=1 Tax=Hippocampus zosterae TaxID=109293 RepID=UPI00223E84E9|nr:complement factor B-like [Hippocampus zosterae]XP_051903115.1 complement factor B-like [Hippocampus zosterae]